MTIEEKARAYDEAVNKFRRFMARGVEPLITRADVQDFFPELAESEDEKIRKDPDHKVSVSFRHDGRLDAVEVTDWPRSHACIRETITTVEQLNQLLNLMHMEAV